MDRQRTDKELDALADLYLTGPDEKHIGASDVKAMAITAHREHAAQRRKGPTAPAPAPGSATPGSPASGSSTAAPISDADFELTTPRYPGTRSTGLMTGPQPARLTAKVKPSMIQPNDPNTSPVNDDHDDLVQQMHDLTAQSQRDEPTLRLVNLELESARPQDADAKYVTQQHAGPPQHSVLEFDEHVLIEDRRVEVVFLGNLPGFASPWMTQYAQHVALECGVVGVLHIDDEQIDLDFVSTPANRNKLDAVHRQIMDFEQADDLIALLDLINQGTTPMVGAWLIHLATPLTATTQTIARSLPVWTLLSGVDEAAGARAMDWLAHCLSTVQPRQMDHVQFMAMGSDIDRAVALIRQLDERALEQWDTSVELVGVQRQMVPVHLQTLGSFPTMTDQWPVIARLLAGNAATTDHRSALVTRIEPSRHQPQAQTPRLEEEARSQAPTAAERAAITAAQTRNLLLAAAKMDGISIQGVELEETETPEAPETTVTTEATVAPATPAVSDTTASITDSQVADLVESIDELDEMEAQAMQMDASDMPQAEDISTHAVPQAEVVSQTVRDFVERLKQQELRKRAQAAAEEQRVKPDVRNEAPASPRPAPQPEPEFISVAQVAAASKSQQDVHATVLGPRPEVAAASPRPQVHEQPVQVAPKIERAIEPQVIHHQPEPMPRSTTGNPPLASYLQNAGIISLIARCPQHPQVEITLDEEGGLHLLARHQQSTGKTVRDALYDMLDARGWVDQHISLLSLTQKQLRFDMQIRPVVHLFTDDARGAAQLVANCARFVKLHLLTDVKVGDTTAHYCTELN